MAAIEVANLTKDYDDILCEEAAGHEEVGLGVLFALAVKAASSSSCFGLGAKSSPANHNLLNFPGET